MKNEISIWDKMAKSFHITSINSRAHKKKYETIAEKILKINPKNILDLGCGSGILEKIIFERGFTGKILAIDDSAPMLEIAEILVNNKNCKFLKRDIEKNLGTRELFDVIVSINLFFFLGKKVNFLSNISKQLNSNDSIFIMITPKPEDKTSDWEFIKEHFKDTNFNEKIFILFNELTNIPYYIKLIFAQKKLDKLAKIGKIKYENPKNISVMAKKANLDIISIDNIHANQNWMFIMKKAKNE